MIPQDYHIHTHFSCDSQSTMREMCGAALELGIPEIGICEHYDLIPEDPCFAFYKVEAWWAALQECRLEFKGRLHIRAGIEIGEPHRFPQAVQDMLHSYPWDYALGSLHWVDSELVFNLSYFDRPPANAYRRYFQELHSMVTQAQFDVLAHLDIVKRYGFEVYNTFDPYSYEKEIRTVLQACVVRGCAIEINTSTLRRLVQEPSPSTTILQWFHELGGRWITLGSDAHQPEDVGADLEQALAAAKSAGFDHLARYENRRPIPLAYPDDCPPG